MWSAPSAPPLRYEATAVRPGWDELTPAVRNAIVERLGAPVLAARTAGAGFTTAFAAVLDTAAGDRVFVKAASFAQQPHLTDWYDREAQVLPLLPPDLPVPRVRWTMTAAGYRVLCLEAVDGRLPLLPWTDAELDAALAMHARISDALRQPPAALVALGLPRLTDLAREDLAIWQVVDAGFAARPDLPPDLPVRLPELAALESLLPGYADVPALIQCDLRPDNMLIDRGGQAWLCDWNWICHGPAWFDLATLLLTAHAGGRDADALFAAHPTARDCPADGLDAALAGLSGYFLAQAAQPPGTASPQVRLHQRWSGEVALGWLSARRGWR
jgi:aminoglycoside phosphotransferase (APT) family kinase protein